MKVCSAPLSHLSEEWGVKSLDTKGRYRERNIPMPGARSLGQAEIRESHGTAPLPPAAEAEEILVDQTDRQVAEPPPLFNEETALTFKVLAGRTTRIFGRSG